MHASKHWCTVAPTHLIVVLEAAKHIYNVLNTHIALSINGIATLEDRVKKRSLQGDNMRETGYGVFLWHTCSSSNADGKG